MKNILEVVYTLKNLIDKIVFYLLSIIITTMLILVVWQVFSRYVLADPAVFTEELVRFLLIWFGLLAAVYAFGSNNHISLTLAFSKFSPPTQKIISICHHTLTLIFAIAFFLYGGGLLVNIVSFQTSSVLGVSMSLVYIIFPFCGIILTIYEIIHIIKIVYTKMGEE